MRINLVGKTDMFLEGPQNQKLRKTHREQRTFRPTLLILSQPTLAMEVIHLLRKENDGHIRPVRCSMPFSHSMRS